MDPGLCTSAISLPVITHRVRVSPFHGTKKLSISDLNIDEMNGELYANLSIILKIVDGYLLCNFRSRHRFNC